MQTTLGSIFNTSVVRGVQWEGQAQCTALSVGFVCYPLTRLAQTEPMAYVYTLITQTEVLYWPVSRLTT